MTTPAIPLSALVDAMAALRAIKDAPFDSVPGHLWRAAHRAHSALEFHMERLPAAPVQVEEEQS